MYQVQINMAEVNETPQWEDCDNCLFESVVQASNQIEWMMVEYGDTIEYRIVEVK